MMLDELLRQRTAEWQPGGRQTLAVPDPDSGWAVILTADRSDPTGCLVWEMTLRRATPPASDAATLAAWAERVASRVTGLLEPLAVIEVDAPRQTAMLRSAEPAQRGDGLFYYEVLLRGAAEATVRRYQGPRDANQRRAQVTFCLTHEALAKLALDLMADK